MRLEKVVHRKPVPFRPHASVPDYLLCYVIETLQCGHTLITFPQADPLVAIRRACKECATANRAKVIEFPAPKKNPLRRAAWRGAA